MIVLVVVALIIVPVAVSDHRRGVQPFDRLDKHTGRGNRDG